MLLGSVALFLAAILLVGYLPLLAMAQQTGTTITTTTTPPLTPEEQEQQNRLQNVIAATNQNLDEAEKEVNGVVYTPRWSDVVWVEPDSLAVLFAYCLPGEFAESGQEILGGFELEVLESYEVALPQNFMAWMMVIGNEDRQDRLPAAVGVICASDTNDVETRVLSPQEQQEINNVVQQFITTQVTNIEQVINIINNITTPQNETGGGITPPPPTNDTGTTTEEQPLTVDIITNATQAYTGATIKFDASITGGAPPYSYTWYVPGFGAIDQDRSITQMFFEPGTFTYILTATDNMGQTASDSVQIHIRERPQGGGGLLGEGVLDNATVAGEGVPLTVNIITNATHAVAPATIRFDASITGGAPPYSYVWASDSVVIDRNRSITQTFSEPGYFVYYLFVTDRTERTWSDVVAIVILEAEGVLPPPETGEEGQPPGGELLPGIAPGEEQQEQPQVPPPTVPEEGEDTTEEEAPPPAEEEQPPATTTEDEGAAATPPGNG